MQIAKMGIRSLLALALIGSVASIAADGDQTKAYIDRTITGSMISVRYEGSSVALIELRVNGTSVTSRALVRSSKGGETNFALEPSLLRAGGNEVEVRLYDSEGKLLLTETATVTVQTPTQGKIYLSGLKDGAKLQGPVELKVGLNEQFGNVYVSFFIDGDFKALRNYPPYIYIWDTARAENGWHDIEAWLVDQNNVTYKTNRARVFVNNPGGRTDRPLADILSPNRLNPGVESEPRVSGVSNPSVADPSSVEPRSAALVPMAYLSQPMIAALVGKPSTTRFSARPESYIGGPKLSVPKARKLTTKAAKPPTTVLERSVDERSDALVDPGTAPASPRTKLVRIVKGARLPNYGKLSISYGSTPVKFDVMPRIEDGVALTPFRHLFERAGGKVDWNNQSKSVNAKNERGEVSFRVGEATADVRGLKVLMELAPYILSGRVIVPLSFIGDALEVQIDYDPTTGHVLIEPKK